MSNFPDRKTFENAYAGKAPWDIGRPQKVFVDAADQVSGSLLDAGCGTGENALFFAGRGHNATGIDFIEVPIVLAEKKAHERGLQAMFLVWDALELDIFPGEFDSIIDCGLSHVLSDEDQQKYINGLESISKPGSKLFLMCFSDEEPGTQGPRRVSQQELRQAFRTGWTFVSLQPARFEVAPNLPDLKFSDGGPTAWFAVMRKT